MGVDDRAMRRFGYERRGAEEERVRRIRGEGGGDIRGWRGWLVRLYNSRVGTHPGILAAPLKGKTRGAIHFTE